MGHKPLDDEDDWGEVAMATKCESTKQFLPVKFDCLEIVFQTTF